MDVFPILYTPRLILRKIQADDIPSLVKHANNKSVSANVLNIPHPYQEPDAVFRISYVWQGFKNKARYVFAIILKEREEFIGEVGLHMDSGNKVAQLGYWVGEELWNKGIATEAINTVLKFGFEKLELNKIFATCYEHNKASQTVLIKNGMANNNLNGGVIQYWLMKEEYEGSTK